MKEGKVLLVDPGLSFAEGGTGDIIRQTPNIGLAYIGTYLAWHDVPVKVIDMPTLKLSYEALEDIIASWQPSIIGFSSVTFNITEAYKGAEVAKKVNPEIITVVGGPHITAVPVETLQGCPAIDIGVLTEGEETMLEIVRCVRNEESIEAIPKIAYRRGQSIRVNQVTDYINDLDALPYPDWSLFDYHRYGKAYSFKFQDMLQLYPLSISRGCPFRCSFCFGQFLGKGTRVRTPDNVIGEIKDNLEKYNSRFFYMTDSNLVVNKEAFRRFCYRMETEGLNKEITWKGQSRINTVDEETLHLMREAGAEMLFFGIESGDEVVLRLNHKNYKLKDVERVVSMAYQAGLNPRASFVLGLPYDTRETVERTVEFAMSLELVSAQFHILDLYPGTEAYELAMRGKAGFKPLEDIKWESMSRSTAVVGVNDLTPEELVEIRRKASSMRTKRWDYFQAVKQTIAELNHYVEMDLAVFSRVISERMSLLEEFAEDCVHQKQDGRATEIMEGLKKLTNKSISMLQTDKSASLSKDGLILKVKHLNQLLLS